MLKELENYISGTNIYFRIRFDSEYNTNLRASEYKIIRTHFKNSFGINSNYLSL